MPIAYLTTPGMTVKLLGQRLEITLPPKPDGLFPMQRWIPIFDIEQVVVDASIHLGPKVLSSLLYRNIPIIFLSNGHFPAGIATPFQRQTQPLAEQLDASRDGDFRLKQSQEHVVAKIKNMRRLIQRFSSHRKQAPVAADWLKAMANQASAAQGIDSLRGIEGATAGRYFETMGKWFPAEMPFDRVHVN